jgi:hypothetical protein
MFCKNFFFIITLLFLSNCGPRGLIINKSNVSLDKGFINKGFALVYSEDLYDQKIISNKINDRSLTIFQNNLKFNTPVKITNILNNKIIIGVVGKNSKYPKFNNSVLSKRIAQELDLNINQPYVEILEIVENSIFIAKKAKTYDQEKNVAVKAPVKSISIKDLNEVKKKKKKTLNLKFSYKIKVADFYFKNTALMMLNRIKTESTVENPKIIKISDKKYRVYLGPFDNIKSLQKSYNDISILEFENIEIIRND